jgi:hypothetical protein
VAFVPHIGMVGISLKSLSGCFYNDLVSSWICGRQVSVLSNELVCICGSYKLNCNKQRATQLEDECDFGIRGIRLAILHEYMDVSMRSCHQLNTWVAAAHQGVKPINVLLSHPLLMTSTKERMACRVL